jgi:hypothetical protein
MIVAPKETYFLLPQDSDGDKRFYLLFSLTTVTI